MRHYVAKGLVAVLLVLATSVGLLPATGNATIDNSLRSTRVAAQYSAVVEQWRPAVEEACAYYGCSTEQLLGVIACESGGDPGAVGPNGELGILQVDPDYWGVMSSEQQIAFAAQDFADGYGDKWVCQGY